MNELPENTSNEVFHKLNKGDKYFAAHKYREAITIYDEVLESLPSPKEDHDIFVLVNLSLGNSYHEVREYGIADYFYNKALEGERGLENALIWYALGKNYIKMGYEEKGIDSLVRAYILGGKELFQVDDFHYFSKIEHLVS